VLSVLFVLARSRERLAHLAGLHWARWRGVDLVVPAAIILVVWATAPALDVDLAGIPALALWVIATGVAVALLRSLPSGTGSTRATTSGLVLVAGVVVAWVLYDVWFWGQTVQLYDLDVYLGSASRWLAGGQPYMAAPAANWPSSAAADFFLYPPPLLPVFGALSRLPHDLVSVGWVCFIVGCAYRSFRILGLPRTWSLVLLAFPPVAIGFESGNVAACTFLLFAGSFRYGGGLIVAGLFKIQAAIPALWLVRTRQWRGLLAGMGAVALIGLVTLPMVGLDSWRAWWEGLGYRAASQQAVPALYGYSMAQLPAAAFSAATVAMTVAALLFRGRRGLAALGLASVFASPALWPHGFVFALPALLMIENGAVIWLVLGVGAFGLNMWLLVGAGWISVAAAARRPAGQLHPLAGTDGLWPRPVRRGAPNRRVPSMEGFGPGWSVEAGTVAGSSGARVHASELRRPTATVGQARSDQRTE
jgi:hypothetical protein